MAKLLLCILMTVLAANVIHAADFKATFGAARVFLDEPFHYGFGGSVRLPFTDRIAFEPRALFTNGERFREWSLLANISIDLTKPGKRVIPYAIGGIGIFNQTDKSIDFNSNDLSASGGVGLRAYLGDRIYLAPEFRLGSHAFPEIAVSLGFVLP